MLRNRRRGASPRSDSEHEPLLEDAPTTTAGNAVAKPSSATAIRPLIERPLLFRLDVGPFLVTYASLIYLDDGSDWKITTVFVVSLVLHFSIVLASQWSNSLRSIIGYRSASDGMTHCFVKTQSTAGIVPVEWTIDDVAIIKFQDVVFRCSPLSVDDDVSLWKASATPRVFRPLFYPVALPKSFYTQWQGHSSLDDVRQASEVYGANQTRLLLPTFFDLLLEQVLAPFFLFQIFCVVLWSLDEYWYYALFTLGALLMFESTLAYNRLQSLQRLHEAGQSGASRIWVHRGSPTGYQWMLVAARELVPGDLVSLAARPQGTPVPADIVVLRGSAVCDEALLTGESVPQLKYPLESAADTLDAHQQDKESILFGGTNLLVSNPPESSTNASPDNGVIGMVLRTGFETAQGSLLRKMAHSTRNADGVHTWDTFVFILMLLLCAVTAAYMVLQEGWNDSRRNRFRLVLHVIMIVTSVVPPELPMELSLAVTNSMSALVHRCQVYCTELFRIPWAGEVDMCCFDKTGTLTSDEMILRGIRLFNDSIEHTNEDDALVHPKDSSVPWGSLRVLAGCHSLAVAGKKNGLVSRLVGDPLEQAVFSETGFTMNSSNLMSPGGLETIGTAHAVSIHHRFPFSSKLKRMSVLATDDGGKDAVWALTKGAPETIRSLCVSNSIPPEFDRVLLHHASKGRRVLAFASRKMGRVGELQSMKDGGRSLIEKDMTFGGFIVLDCPLKPDSKRIISELRKSSHQVAMITGDAMLTAVDVARQVGIIHGASRRNVFVAEEIPNHSKETSFDPLSAFRFVPLYGKGETAISLSNTTEISRLREANEGWFCLSGDLLMRMASAAASSSMSKDHTMATTTTDHESNDLLALQASVNCLTRVVPFISVYARHSPQQKEAVIAALNHAKFHTMMCGDGTNDVGALKRAHVGISIISAPGIEAKHRSISERLSQAKSRSRKEAKQVATEDHLLQEMQKTQHEIDLVELGDASVAAPFTSRALSIRCCKDVIVQGRCTLVTMLQIYKILGINCLVNAMVLSTLFLHGVKQGDRQLTILGIVVAAMFYFITRAEPLPKLSAERPPASVLCAQALLSIGLQFFVHMFSLNVITTTAMVFVDPYDPSLVPDGSFNPNVLNTCTFLVTCLTTVNTFAANYRGHPFMQSLTDNKLMYRSLQACYTVIILCVFEVFPPLNDLMQLSQIPNDVSPIESDATSSLIAAVGFPAFMASVMALNTLATFVVERLTLRAL